MACIAKRRGKYVIDFYDTYGKRRWITMPKGTTKKKAKEKFREVEDQLRRGIYLPDKKIPNFKQVAKDWIEHKKPNLRHSTWSVYEGHTKNHFDDFDPIKINRITTAKVEKWISARHNEGMNIATIKKIPIFKQVAKDWIEHKKPNLRQSTWSVYEGHTRNHFDDFDPIKINRVTTAKIEKWISARHNEGMNLATIKKIIVTLGQIMAYAVRHGYIDYNSAMDAERPRGNGESEESKIRVLTPAEINSFLEAERDMKYPTLFTLAIFSGARQGELLGLKWSDIDWESNQIHI